MRRILFLTALALPLAACMSTQQDAHATAAPLSTMNAAAAIPAPDGPYLWACGVPGTATAESWGFSIVSQANETGHEILLQTEGSAGAMSLGRRSEGRLEIFEASSTRIEIAPDGGARVTWPGLAQSVAAQCRKGAAT